MREQFTDRLNELARRAGLSGMPPAAVWAAMALCVVVVLGAAWRWWPRQGAVSAAETPAAVAADTGGASAETGPGADKGGVRTGDATPGAAPEQARVYVHVVGAVRHPGMYELEAGGRVNDAIAAAGGMLGNAAQAGVNLARAVTDGEQIVVPTADEFAKGGAASAGPGAAAASGQSGTAGAAAGGPVNINTADATALDTLPGVGPSTAAKIVAEREANGPFSSPDDLGRVAGIGPKKLEELKPRVCVK